MRWNRSHEVGLILSMTAVLWIGQVARADGQATPATPTREAQALARKIDRHLAARWKSEGIKPARASSDAEFFRRLCLDLVGRIPSILEIRDFLDDDRPDKRALWIDKVLADEAFANHFANVWRAWLLEQATSEQVPYIAPGLTAWLRERLQKNTGYDQIVREILTAPANQGGALPSSFLQANELKVESLAANTSRLFLGVKLECAQCHNHPFGKWTREQFWEYAAFFSGIDPQGTDTPNRREITIPGTDKVIAARFLNGDQPNWNTGNATRNVLADWLTRPDNPFFARAAVNRMWSYFFGIGLIDPLDEPDDKNPPSHPELLDELARQFAAQRFDLKFLARAIVNSRAYQLTSASRRRTPENPRLLSRMSVRGLSPEQLFDSLAEATGYQKSPATNSALILMEGVPATPEAEFLTKFANHDRRTEAQTTILQALTLMNGKVTADSTSLERSNTLAQILESGKISTERRIETLYLVTLSRMPRAEELTRLVKYVDGGGPTGDAKKALADVFWALLNCGEFMLNH